MTLPRMILTGCWLIAMAVWLAMAFTAKADIRAQKTEERESYSLLFLASILFTVLPMRGPPPADDGAVAAAFLPLVPDSEALQWTSALIALVGLGLALWARLTLGRNWSAAVAIKQDHTLITSGPYRAIRHPIYTALLLLLLATCLAVRAPFSIAGFVLMALSCWIKLRAEEAMMREAFPEHYPPYAARTKRLVPGLF